MTTTWSWIPNKSLGPIEIGSDIKTHIENLDAEYIEDFDDTTDWKTYYIEGAEVYAEAADDSVVSITAYVEFIYKGHNFIGMPTIQLDDVLECSPDEIGESVEDEDGEELTSFDYEKLGLQIWESKGIITSATCLTNEGFS